MAVQEINVAGGIDERQIELITRDTQSDPTKAVNGAAELTRGAEGESRPRPGQFRRVARGRVDSCYLRMGRRSSSLSKRCQI